MLVLTAALSIYRLGGGDYMIPVGRDEILSRYARIPEVLWTLHKLHPAITFKTFHPG